MENPKLEEENIITDSENLFRLEKLKKLLMLRYIKSLFRL